ncbi:MAG TPA: hypothetical protein G4O12_05655 [Dehalococcoidia bacterium]|nr:hypothetical protein [Dehalococcoidia bacterium]
MLVAFILAMAMIVTGLAFSIFTEIRNVGIWLIGIGGGMVVAIAIIYFLEKWKGK